MRIVAFHGFLGLPADFEGFKKKLSAQVSSFDFFAPFLFENENSLPNSFKDWPDFFEKELVPKISFQLQQDPTSPRLLMGYSFGGRLALDLFLARNDLFDRLILLAPNPGLLTNQDKSLRLAKDAAWSKKISESNWPSFIAEWNSQEIFKFDRALPQERYSGDFSILALKKSLDVLSLGHMRAQKDDIQKLQNRIFWVSGESDPKITPLYSQLKSQGLIRHWGLIPRAGHRLLQENPAEIAQQLVHFLKL